MVTPALLPARSVEVGLDAIRYRRQRGYAPSFAALTGQGTRGTGDKSNPTSNTYVGGNPEIILLIICPEK